jgi:hypothetical protein
MTGLPQIPVIDHAGSTQNFEALQTQLAQLKETLQGTGGAPVGGWIPTVLGEKVEQLAGFQTIRVRAELHGATVRLRGAAVVKAGQELASGETVLTLPVGYRPLEKVRMVGVTETTEAARVSITTAGVLSFGIAVKEGRGIYLDGLTFNLT